MNKLLLLAILLAFTCSTFAQSVDLRRKIEVSGTAEQEVTPDIINVSISLQEYMNGKNKVTIDVLESQLENAVTEAGIAKEDFTINNISANNNYDQKKKDPDFLAAKQYNIRFHDLDKFNRVLSGVDPKGVQSTNIDSYDYSKITELKHDLKIKALLAAKDKATYLLNSVGEKLGGVIDITEVDNGNTQGFIANRAVLFSPKAQVADSDIDFKKIKLSFQINAVFEIVN